MLLVSFVVCLLVVGEGPALFSFTLLRLEDPGLLWIPDHDCMHGKAPFLALVLAK
jgi:hypothetical protein